MFDESLVDRLMLASTLVYNGLCILVFVFRGLDKEVWERRVGPFFSSMLIPFTLSWVINLTSGADSSLLIAGAPIIIFLGYDLWYRSIAKSKPRHHPEKWPRELVLYLLLYHFGGITLNGYSFLVSLGNGSVALASYFAALGSYFFYQYRYNRRSRVEANVIASPSPV
jgi:hypothetical protein